MKPTRRNSPLLDRRRFLATTSTAVAASALTPGLLGAAAGRVATRREDGADTWVRRLHESLSEKQREVVQFPFEHDLRSKVANNWHVVPARRGSIGRLYNAEQKEMVRSILQGLLTEDGYERLQGQMKDDSGGLDHYTCAFFGKPGDGPCQWVITGRHLTMRADSNSVPNACLGGPVFYGHAVDDNERPDHPGNVWWHQARLANEVFKTFDGKQREKALMERSPPDHANSTRLRGRSFEFSGLPVSELTDDQKPVVKKALRGLLDMFRQRDVDEVLAAVEANGGLDKLHLSFFQAGDLGSDGVWDRWRISGPAFQWYFRGSPHVHVWLNVAKQAPGDARRRDV